MLTTTTDNRKIVFVQDGKKLEDYKSLYMLRSQQNEMRMQPSVRRSPYYQHKNMLMMLNFLPFCESSAFFGPSVPCTSLFASKDKKNYWLARNTIKWKNYNRLCSLSKFHLDSLSSPLHSLSLDQRQFCYLQCLAMQNVRSELKLEELHQRTASLLESPCWFSRLNSSVGDLDLDRLANHDTIRKHQICQKCSRKIILKTKKSNTSAVLYVLVTVFFVLGCLGFSMQNDKNLLATLALLPSPCVPTNLSAYLT